MGRRTPSNLQRETGVSRNTIYKKATELNLPKMLELPNREYSIEDYERLRNLVLKTKEKKDDQEQAAEEYQKVALKSKDKNIKVKKLSLEENTSWERLKDLKEQYDYNLKMIISFKNEAEAYREKHGTTSMKTAQGTFKTIPSIGEIDTYTKLNIRLNKSISELEKELDLNDKKEDDPFQ